MTPVYLTSTYAQEGPGEHKGFEYSRTRNPTRDALQGCLAALEGGKHALAFASGLAATDAVLHLCNAGDHVVFIGKVEDGQPPAPGTKPLMYFRRTYGTWHD